MNLKRTIALSLLLLAVTNVNAEKKEITKEDIDKAIERLNSELTLRSNALSELSFRALLIKSDKNDFVSALKNLLNIAKGTLPSANSFSRNFLSTFFTNQSAVQSTCLGASCAVPMIP